MQKITKAQARTLLLGLGHPSSEAERAAAIGVVLDLLDVALLVDEPPPNVDIRIDAKTSWPTS